MLDIKRVDTNTSEIKGFLSYGDIVATLGMRVGLEGGLPSSAPGTTVVVEWDGVGENGTPSGAMVHVVVDHNYVSPASPVTAAPIDDGSPSAAPVAAAPTIAVPSAGLVIPSTLVAQA